MINFRLILSIIGILLTVLSISMLIPLGVDYYFDNPDWKGFGISAFLCFFIGMSLMLSCYTNELQNISIKETFLLTTLSWISLTFFSSLPLYFSDLNLSYADSFFEAASGITTTGATIIPDLDIAPPGILVWRALLQWIGGVGIIVLAIGILPMLRIGGMQLFRTESSDQSDKVLPRASKLASTIGVIYIFITLSCASLLYFSGMSSFDAILHALTTVSTGGFSTHNESVGYFNSSMIEIIIIIFMIISAIPFPFYIRLLNGYFSDLFKDHQVIFFAGLLIFLSLITAYWANNNLNYSFIESLRYATFNVVSVVTTTGFASTDYNLWGSFAITLFFVITVVGGCTGSTAGGIKIFRFQILYYTAKHQIKKLIQPHGVFKMHYNGNTVSEATSNSVLSFFILFCFCFTVLSVLLSFSGHDYITSMSAAASVLANVGPGLGDMIGPAGNYSEINESMKWALSAGMIVGRLEIFTVFILFTASFWKD